MLGVVLLAMAVAETPVVRYDGHQVVRAHPRGPGDLQLVHDLVDDVWSHAVTPEGGVVLRVAPRERAALMASGIDVDVLVADVQPVVDAERARLSGAMAQGAAFFEDFRDFAALDAHLDELAALAPDRVEVVEIGQSIEGRTIRGARISAVQGGRPAAVLLTGTMHAREWLSPMVTACLAEALVVEGKSDPRLGAILDAVEVWVIPVLNPDGYVYSWEVERYWRKNRRDAIGVDLNRNFSTNWGGPGSSGNPEDENYRGAGPLSEPEAQALADFVQAHPQIVTHVDFHSFGRLVLHPWSSSAELAPDHDALAELGAAQADVVLAGGGGLYTVLRGWDLYPASGVVDDWAYEAQGVFSFATELPPGPDEPGDFVVAPALIASTCAEQRAALVVLGEWAAQFSELGEGDTTGGGGSGASSGGEGSSTAAADGTSTGSSGGGAGTVGGPEPASSSVGASTGGDTDPGENARSGAGDGCACEADPGERSSGRLGWLLLAALGLSVPRSSRGRVGTTRARTARRRDR